MELRTVTKSKNFNLNVLRHIAAMFVMGGHMAYLVAGCVPSIMFAQIQTIGVYILFSLSGALIVRSWCNDPNLIRYSCKRFFRIFPPLVVFTLLMVFIAGPLLSTLSVKEYFSSYGALLYLKNIILFPIYSLPGVFIDLPYANVVNGSLWTIPIEIAMYCLIPLIVYVSGFNKKSNTINWILILITVFICCVDLWISSLPERPVLIIWGTNWIQALDVIPFYFIGMLYASPLLQRILNIKVALILLAVGLCFAPTLLESRIILYLLIPYFCFSFIYAEPIFYVDPDKCHDISYGIYLYGFFIQQLVVEIYHSIFKWTLPQNSLFVISMVITCILALLSEKYIEQPASQICKYICEKYCNNN